MKMAANVNSHQFNLCRQWLRANFQMKIWGTVRVSPTIYLSALVHCFPSQHITHRFESNYFHCCHLGVLKVDAMSEKLTTVHATWFSLDNLSDSKNDHNLKKILKVLLVLPESSNWAQKVNRNLFSEVTDQGSEGRFLQQSSRPLPLC